MSRDAAINGMFGRIAGFYDLLNRILSLGVDQYWRAVLASQSRPGQANLVLDLAAGTLDVAIKLSRKWPDARILALDFCQPMLARGMDKLKGQAIAPCVADARKIPMPDKAAGSVTIAFGIRNINPRKAAFSEMLRVLEPGGQALVLEFGSAQERIWGGLYNFYLARLLPGIAKTVGHDRAAYEYLARTVREFPNAGVLADEMREAGFINVHYRKLSGGIVCLHYGSRPA